MRIALDSSVWIETWKSSRAAQAVLEQVEQLGGDPDRFVVPATVVHETYRWLLRNEEQDQRVAEHAAVLEPHDHVSIDAHLARRAAVTSVTTGLAHADATILAATRSRHAHLLTYDSDFEGIPDVTVLAR